MPDRVRDINIAEWIYKVVFNQSSFVRSYSFILRLYVIRASFPGQGLVPVRHFLFFKHYHETPNFCLPSITFTTFPFSYSLLFTIFFVLFYFFNSIFRSFMYTFVHFKISFFYCLFLFLSLAFAYFLYNNIFHIIPIFFLSFLFIFSFVLTLFFCLWLRRPLRSQVCHSPCTTTNERFLNIKSKLAEVMVPFNINS